MEINDYLNQIDMDFGYFYCIHRTCPQTIFMSNKLFSIIARDGYIMRHSDGGETLFGVPVQMYYSDKLEYHFAVSKYEF